MRNQWIKNFKGMGINCLIKYHDIPVDTAYFHCLTYNCFLINPGHDPGGGSTRTLLAGSLRVKVYRVL